MKLTILGCYAATPLRLSNPTSQVLEDQNKCFLIDCGEGTQLQLRKNKINFSKIEEIFISHLHGDHFYGLPGLITTFNLLGRDKPLRVFCPVGGKKAVETLLKISESLPRYELIFHELYAEDSEKIYENKTLEVYTIPLVHRIYANGYLFRQKTKPRKLNADEFKRHNIDKSYIQDLKDGKSITLSNGTELPNAILTFNPQPPKNYAFCSDTAYNPAIVNVVKGVDVLYHESTFLQEHLNIAMKTKHSTAMQAAQIAKQSEVKKLILGHYSTRYRDIQSFKKEAELFFDNVELANDGKVFVI